MKIKILSSEEKLFPEEQTIWNVIHQVNVSEYLICFHKIWDHFELINLWGTIKLVTKDKIQILRAF